MRILKLNYKALRALLAVLVISVSTSGCTTKLAYDFLDWGLYWELKDYVKFTRDQRLLVKDEISQLIDWHRSEELPQYADQLEKLSKELKSGITVEQLEESYNNLRDSWQRIVIKTLPATVDIISNLNDEQVNDFFEMLIEKEGDDAKKIEKGTNARTLKKREAYVSKKIVGVIGKLNEDQKSLIAQWALSMKPTKELSLAQAIQWRTRMQTVLAERHNEQQLENNLMVLFANPDQLRSTSYRRVIEKNKRLIMQLLFDLNQTLTKQQRSKLVKKLQSYINDFRDLSDRP
ncbi:prominin family protein [Oceanospirillaceae bacterium]|nr:prominin family protein [Oceanospirillaceae bacterium]MDC0084229.1 prominin family protein [Oceanospirillaceae bacterium]MDC1424737.1 prominin family protein [Oceanospirillaceae bacterium]